MNTRPLLRWGVACGGLLLAGVAVDAVRATPSSTLAQSLAPYVSASPDRRLVNAAIVLHADDCSSNLRTMYLLHRAAVREKIRLAVIWYAGDVSDSLRIRPLLPSWAQDVPLRRIPRAAVGELKRLGHHSTPMLVVLDQDGRIRFTTQSPRSSREYAGLQRIIEGLTWTEEL